MKQSWPARSAAAAITAFSSTMRACSMPDAFSLSLAIAWLSFLMLANALFHIVASFVDGSYVPGLVTAALFYLPYSFWLATKIMKSRRVKVSMLIGAAVVGAIPMVVHGYRILFLGSRLF
jgi:hypothetical protein